MSTKFQVDDIADPHVHNPEETLVPLLELALIENLHCYHRRVLDGTAAQ